MDYAELDTAGYEPLVSITYAREMKRVAHVPAASKRVPEPVVAETLTLDVHSAASVDVTVSTDGRGTLREITYRGKKASGLEPRAWSPAAQVDVFARDATAPWQIVGDPGLTFKVALVAKDAVLHVSVRDLNTGTVSDQFITLGEWRADIKQPSSQNTVHDTTRII